MPTQPARPKPTKPAATRPLRDTPRDATLPWAVNQPMKVTGNPVPHGVTGNRFAFPLPVESKGPIRAREARKRKGLEGY